MVKDVATDPAARRELMNRYGRMATPTLVIGERMFLGFRENRKEIEKLLDSLSGGTRA